MLPLQAQLLATYNRWMNARLYELCASLSDTERKQDRGAFFSSIHGTLNHLLLADRVWLGRFTDEPFVVTGLDQELFTDFEELRRQRETTDEAILEWSKALTDQELARVLHYGSIVNPARRSCPMWLAVTHFFNHQTHHRGQLTTLLSPCGIDPGVTDLIGLPDDLKSFAL